MVRGGESITLLSQTARSPEAETDAQHNVKASKPMQGAGCFLYEARTNFERGLASTEHHLQAPCSRLPQKVPVKLWQLFLPAHRRWWRGGLAIAEVSAFNTRGWPDA